MQRKLLVLLLSAILASFAAVADVKPQPTCHLLMTEKECSEHKTRLASLPPGAALDHYRAEYASTRQERESACRCTDLLSIDETAPRQWQAMLLF